MTSLAALALASSASIFPPNVCGTLPAAPAQIRDWVAKVEPELAGAPVRIMTDEAAHDLLERARRAGWSGFEVFSSGLFRGDCVYYFQESTLGSVYSAYELNLLSAIAGTDNRGRPFHMAAMLGGRGRITAVYDRGGIVYRNEQQGREFKLAQVVRFQIPREGVLDPVSGLSTSVFLLGDLQITRFEKAGPGKVKLKVGSFDKDGDLVPIESKRSPRRPEALEPLAIPTPAGQPSALEELLRLAPS
jgi:hypothetical protein